MANRGKDLSELEAWFSCLNINDPDTPYWWV